MIIIGEGGKGEGSAVPAAASPMMVLGDSRLTATGSSGDHLPECSALRVCEEAESDSLGYCEKYSCPLREVRIRTSLGWNISMT